jgi:uncharacterized membrane protein
MKINLIFPSILIVLDIGAGLSYFISGNWKMGIYWVCAAALTACVTF